MVAYSCPDILDKKCMKKASASLIPTSYITIGTLNCSMGLLILLQTIPSISIWLNLFNI